MDMVVVYDSESELNLPKKHKIRQSKLDDLFARGDMSSSPSLVGKRKRREDDRLEEEEEKALENVDRFQC